MLESILDMVNGVGSALSTAISINYVVGDYFYWCLRVGVSAIYSGLVSVFAVIWIMFEDLWTFLSEISEIFVVSVEAVFSAVDALLFGIFSTFCLIQACVFNAASSTINGFQCAYDAGLYFADSLVEALRLLGSCVLFLLSLAPRTLYMIYNFSFALIKRSAEGLRTTVTNAPVESLVGLLTGVLLAYATNKTVQRYNIAGNTILNLSLRILCFFYETLLRTLINTVKLAIRCVELTVTHLHVPTFHQAGHEEAEDEDNEVVVDESDDEENERILRKQKQISILISSEKSRGSIEEMLCLQVEKEREEKLCVICQDQEKCIMILPCRHLCICQDCQSLLLSNNNNCPICRKIVKQTIKAYL